MRTFEEFERQMIEAHDCDKCHGKIVCIKIDAFCNQYCAYCGEIVDYPIATIQEMRSWMEKAGVR